MIYMWFTGTNYYKLAVEKDRDSIFTTKWIPSLMTRKRRGFLINDLSMSMHNMVQSVPELENTNCLSQTSCER
jgi:hypothetical protein